MTADPAPAAAPEPDPVPLTFGGAVSVGGLSQGRLLALAAAGPAGSGDPVTEAIADTMRLDHANIPVPRVDPADVDPASPGRRYSLVRVRALTMPDGSTEDTVVMRGDLMSVLASSRASRAVKNLLRRNAGHATAQGERPLAIAQAPVGADGTVGEFQLQGFVTVRPASARDAEENAADDGSWARIHLWSASLRIQHWANVVLIFVMSCTGYYIMDPFFGATWHDGVRTGYLMGWVRLIHFTAGFCWLLVGLTRVVAAFTSRDRYLRWPSLWPLKSKADVRNLGRTAQFYAFIRREGPLYLGHNPLQQLSYTAVYALCAVQMCTGLVLFGLYQQSSPFWAFVSTPVHWFGIAPVRMFHAMVMFVLWAFVIMHIYLAVRADTLERHGGVSAMLNGGVWLRRGSRPTDAPVVE